MYSTSEFHLRDPVAGSIPPAHGQSNPRDECSVNREDKFDSTGLLPVDSSVSGTALSSSSLGPGEEAGISK